MWPILFEWGDSIIVPSWHVSFLIAAFVAYFVLSSLLKCHVEHRRIVGLYVVCYLGGYFGARLFAILVEEPRLAGFADFFGRLASMGSMTFFGGFIASWLAGIIYCLAYRISIARCADAAMIAGLFALSIGRIGCFLNGDDYGIPVPLNPGQTAPWWSVVFPNHQDLIPRYPVQLIESGAALVLAMVGWCLFRKEKKLDDLFSAPGFIALALVSGYALFRFFIEYWRGDPRGWVGDVTILTPSQLVSIGILIIANFVMLRNYLSGQKKLSK